MDGKTVIDAENNTYENIFGSRRMREFVTCFYFLYKAVCLLISWKQNHKGEFF